MTNTTKVVFCKPDFAVVGGFELLLDRCRAGLRARGVDATIETFNAHEAPAELAGLPVPPSLWHGHAEYFTYAANVERVAGMEFPDDTVVVATQPPTYLLDHPRLVCLTYHQARVFYDLAEPYVASGYIDADLHRLATEQVHAIDAHHLGATPHGARRRWLAGSAEVAARLDRWFGVPDVPLFTAKSQEPPDHAIAEAHDPAGTALCVSRHAWPKRTELAVLAAVCDPAGAYELVGGGGRQPYVEALARAYAGRTEDARDCGDDVIWRNQGDPAAIDRADGSMPSNLTITGQRPRPQVVDAYRRAAVVIAPAHREDYGLTVLEAFSYGRPVIVCDDGGGLVELVEGTGGGVVVSPRPGAVADAVRALRADPARLATMAEAAFTTAVELHRRDDLAVLHDAIAAAASD